jgi:hypothetical protein
MKKNFLIIIVVILVLAAIGYMQYDSLVKSGSKNIDIGTVMTSLSVSSDTAGTMNQVDSLLSTLQQVSGLNQFDPAFLASDNFANLKDFSIVLLRAQNPGRNNPFQSITSSGGLEADTTATSIDYTKPTPVKSEQIYTIGDNSVLDTSKKNISSLTNTVPKKSTTQNQKDNSAKKNFQP